jgi:hypothetical protein
MTDDGILLSHDCCPPKKEYSTPDFKKGWWCGVTYICFVELAYNNPQWFYGVINNDNGVGILSKQKLDHLEQNFNREKQEQLIKMNKDLDPSVYDYYIKNAKELINLYKRAS